jgi:hypothetical protein
MLRSYLLASLAKNFTQRRRGSKGRKSFMRIVQVPASLRSADSREDAKRDGN